jgi:BirA family transcriptional regulator, biotin operon repressor / biotin---[acetyl-CoA-carboxylase] ligase
MLIYYPDICSMQTNLFHYFDRLSSTNEVAIEWIAKTRPAEGTLLYTGFQTGGRGQFGSIWESEADKNVLMTVVLYPSHLEPQRLFYLQMALSLTLLTCVRQWLPGVDFCLKWPNDLYTGQRKVAGILMQTGVRGRHTDYAVFGVGLNVYQMQFSSDLPDAVSLGMLGFSGGSVHELVAILHDNLMRDYREFGRNRWDGPYSRELKSRYEASLCWRGEKRRFISAEGGEFHGRILGVSEDGQLEVETETGIRLFMPRTLRSEPLLND